MSDNLDLLREFRSEIGEPDADAQAAALRQILATATPASAPRRRLTRSLQRRHVTGVISVGAVAAAAAVGLLFLSPWQSGPAALTSAEAAVVIKRALAAVSPSGGRIFHQKSELTFVPAPGAGRYVTVSSETWKESAPPYRFRIVNPIPYAPGIEIGGTGEPARGFAYDSATDTLYRDDALAAALGTTGIASAAPGISPATRPLEDTVERLRGAIENGAPVTKTAIDGRTVYRIGTSIDGPTGFDGWAYYVDTSTYAPVRVETAGYPLAQPGGRVTPNGFAVGKRYPASKSVERILVYEYLEPTADAIEFADIEAQHPAARREPSSHIPKALRGKLRPLTFTLPRPTINPRGAPAKRLLVDVEQERLGNLRLGQPLQVFMASWPQPEFFTKQQTLDPRYPAVALWRAADVLPWAAVDFRDEAALGARSIYYRGPFQTTRGDRNGTPLTTFLEHWPNHQQPIEQADFTRVQVETSYFWFDLSKRLIAVQIGLGSAYTYAGFPR